MLLIDVVLLSTQEQISTSKGVNLLNALILQLGNGAGNVAAYSRVNNSTVSSDANQESNSMESRMQMLRDKFGFSNSMPGNIEAVMTQLDSNDFFREFRQGDVSMERWERMRTTGDRLKEAWSFCITRNATTS